MARTKAQALRQSSPLPWDERILVRTLDDHGSAPVKIAWARTDGNSSPLPLFPFFVYLSRGAESLTVDETLIDKLVSCLQSQQLCDSRWHLEVFTTIQDNICACIDHYEQEKLFRKSGCYSPYMPDKDCFLVVDSQRPLPADFLAELRPDENEDDRRFSEDHEAEREAHFNSAGTFQPSLYERYRGSWEVGNNYTVELQHGTTIPRWTWGTADNLQGPYGLPALNIEVEDGGNRHFMLVD